MNIDADKTETFHLEVSKNVFFSRQHCKIVSTPNFCFKNMPTAKTKPKQTTQNKIKKTQTTTKQIAAKEK